MFEARHPRNRALAFSTIGAFLLIEGLVRYYDLYHALPLVDVPIHVSSGAAVTATMLWFFVDRGSRRPRRAATWSNAVVAVLWEVAETVDELISPDPPYLQDFFFWDGVLDIAAALAGGVVLLGATRRWSVV